MAGGCRETHLSLLKLTPNHFISPHFGLMPADTWNYYYFSTNRIRGIPGSFSEKVLYIVYIVYYAVAYIYRQKGNDCGIQ